MAQPLDLRRRAIPRIDQEWLPIDVARSKEAHSLIPVEALQCSVLGSQLLPQRTVVVKRPQQFGQVTGDRPEFERLSVNQLGSTPVDLGKCLLPLTPPAEICRIRIAIRPTYIARIRLPHAADGKAQHCEAIDLFAQRWPRDDGAPSRAFAPLLEAS